MMLTTMMLATGLLATTDAPKLDAEAQKGWVVEVRGFTNHRGQPALPKGWTVEVRGYTYHQKVKAKANWIIEIQWGQPKPQVQAVEAHYHDDLSAFFKKVTG